VGFSWLIHILQQVYISAKVKSRQYFDSIAYLYSQSSIYTLNKIAQEEAQIVDKQMLF